MAETPATQCCRSCGTPLSHVFVDLGMSPVSNAMRHPSQARDAEAFYPLKTFVCGDCKLVQIEDVQPAETHFHGNYTYFSSYSASWLAHAERYAAMMTERFKLGPQSRVIEVASNDGYLLQYFKTRGIPVLGIDPPPIAPRWRSVSGASRRWFASSARRRRQRWRPSGKADVIAGNNVLAHVPDINDFVSAAAKSCSRTPASSPSSFRICCGSSKPATSIRSTTSTIPICRCCRSSGCSRVTGSAVFDVEELTTHGGSLAHLRRARRRRSCRIRAAYRVPRAGGCSQAWTTCPAYAAFAGKVRHAKRALLSCLIKLKEEGASIVAYGAAAKGNTLLNYCGIRGDMLDYTVDASPHKQGLLLPGTAHSRLRAGAHLRDQARLRADPAVEPQGRDHRAMHRHPRLGRALHHSAAAARDHCMRFEETPLAGAFVIEPEPISDNRGFFARLFCTKAFAERGLNPHLDQISMSHNARAGTLRGLHLQRPPHAEAKLVRVTAGAIFDVIVDVRAGSPTFGRWFGAELSAANRRQLYIPEGFAHGFQTLSADSEVAYHISAPYAPGVTRPASAGTIPSSAIAWPAPLSVTISSATPDCRCLPASSP